MYRLVGIIIILLPVLMGVVSIPNRAYQYLPILKTEIEKYWPSCSFPSVLAGQVHQESRWNPKAELKTKREYGFGFVQITITDRFNNFEEFKKLHSSLREWKWEERFDPIRQLRVLVLQDKLLYGFLSFGKTEEDKFCFVLSSYNGGKGGLLKDRQLCKSNGGDPNIWFGNVEKYSWKSKVAVKGYGKSFYEINREYVRNIIRLLAPLYRSPKKS